MKDIITPLCAPMRAMSSKERATLVYFVLSTGFVACLGAGSSLWIAIPGVLNLINAARLLNHIPHALPEDESFMS